MTGTILIYVLTVGRAAAAIVWHIRTRPIAGGLGDTDLPDPPGS